MSNDVHMTFGPFLDVIYHKMTVHFLLRHPTHEQMQMAQGHFALWQQIYYFQIQNNIYNKKSINE